MALQVVKDYVESQCLIEVLRKWIAASERDLISADDRANLAEATVLQLEAENNTLTSTVEELKADKRDYAGATSTTTKLITPNDNMRRVSVDASNPGNTPLTPTDQATTPQAPTTVNLPQLKTIKTTQPKKEVTSPLQPSTPAASAPELVVMSRPLMSSVTTSSSSNTKKPQPPTTGNNTADNNSFWSLMGWTSDNKCDDDKNDINTVKGAGMGRSGNPVKSTTAPVSVSSWFAW